MAGQISHNTTGETQQHGWKIMHSDRTHWKYRSSRGVRGGGVTWKRLGVSQKTPHDGTQSHKTDYNISHKDTSVDSSMN